MDLGVATTKSSKDIDADHLLGKMDPEDIDGGAPESAFPSRGCVSILSGLICSAQMRRVGSGESENLVRVMKQKSYIIKTELANDVLVVHRTPYLNTDRILTNETRGKGRFACKMTTSLTQKPVNTYDVANGGSLIPRPSLSPCFLQASTMVASVLGLQ